MTTASGTVGGAFGRLGAIALPGVLPRYLLRTYLATFLRVLVSIMLVIVLIDTIEVSRRGASAADFTLLTALAISLLRAPNILLTSMPFLVLIAAMITLLALNKRQELVIIRASGVSAWQFIAPLCVGSLLIGAVTIAVINPLSARFMAQLSLWKCSSA
ncbi:MAG: LptF/LptG family permease [Phyllobacteriaceae bacterium]|nr:LptF/LptG family permease [Phyllobacteriaceae bacterium]